MPVVKLCFVIRSFVLGCVFKWLKGHQHELRGTLLLKTQLQVQAFDFSKKFDVLNLNVEV